MKKICVLLLFSSSFITCVAQNVGIGTTVPRNILDIKGAAVIGSNYGGSALAPSNSLLVEGRIGIGTETPQNILDVEGSAVIGAGYSGTRMAPFGGLLVEGKVGIGIYDPVNQLDVLGGMAIGAPFAANVTAPGNGLIVSGNVGIGTASPLNKLGVGGGAVIGLGYAETTTAPVDGLLVQGSVGVGTTLPKNKMDIFGGVMIGGTGYAGVATAPSWGLVVEGNVGFGTTIPMNKLDVEGSMAIGAAYSGNSMAPAHGLLVEGAVGIGTNTPQNKLDIEGNMVIGSGFAGTMAAPSNSLLVENRIGINNVTPQNRLDINGSASIGYVGVVAPTNGLLVQGRVGIGSINPTVPLEVMGDAMTLVNPYFFMAPGGIGPSPPVTNNLPVSIKASSRIVATEFDAHSDQRIKMNIKTSSSQEDLARILKIRVADYQLKDSIYNGITSVKGFIAQELKTVLPQAVHTGGDYVPDLYCFSSSTSFDEKNKSLTISLSKPHNLQVGDKVKLIAADGLKEQYVSVIGNAHEFTISNWQLTNAGMNPISKIFVWGKWVNDFHTVDYNQVFSMGIGAIQQLAKENSELKEKAESLQQRVEVLEKLITTKALSIGENDVKRIKK